MFFTVSSFGTVFQRNEYWKCYLKYEKKMLKRERNTCRIEFLGHSLPADINPKFIKFQIPTNG